LTALLARFEVPIAEYPISYAPRTIEEGKKISWKDWFRWMWVFLKIRISVLHPIPDDASVSVMERA
ncbi:MAG: hypothetical protein AAB728_02430, partial [Patescibacteria group bacterium]